MYHTVCLNTHTYIYINIDVTLSHRVHVKRVYTQIESSQVHALKNLLEGLTTPTLNVNDLLGIFLHGSLNESQQVLLVHAG